MDYKGKAMTFKEWLEINPCPAELVEIWNAAIDECKKIVSETPNSEALLESLELFKD